LAQSNKIVYLCLEQNLKRSPASYIQLFLGQALDSVREAAVTEKRHVRADAARRILAIRDRISPDPEGWTSREYIGLGRR
jgi:hypothetical protein